MLIDGAVQACDPTKSTPSYGQSQQFVPSGAQTKKRSRKTMAPTHALFQLTEDIARCLAALLLSSELKTLVHVCRAADVSAFRTICDEPAVVLTLPPDLATARSLLINRDLLRRYKSILIRVSSPWCFDVLFEPDIREYVRTVRLEGDKSAIMKFEGLIDRFGSMEALQELQLIHSYDSVPRLMAKLVPYQFYFCSATTIPQCTQQNRHQLDFSRISSTTELCAFSSASETMRIVGVEFDDLWRREVTQKSIYFVRPPSDKRTSASGLSDSLKPRVPLDAVSAMASVEHLYVRIDYFQQQNFQAIRLLPQLTNLVVTGFDAKTWAPHHFGVNNAENLIVELVKLPLLKHVEWNGPGINALQALHHLESLRIGFRPHTRDYLEAFTSLRVLDLDLPAGAFISFGPRSLPHLEEFRVRVYERHGPLSSQALSNLRNLRKLILEGPIHDWSGLSVLTKLQTLSIAYKADPSRSQDARELRCLTRLRELDLRQTDLRDASALADLRELREVFIPEDVDCAPLVGLPKLVQLLHLNGNCLQSCPRRGHPIARTAPIPLQLKTDLWRCFLVCHAAVLGVVLVSIVLVGIVAALSPEFVE